MMVSPFILAGSSGSETPWTGEPGLLFFLRILNLVVFVRSSARISSRSCWRVLQMNYSSDCDDMMKMKMMTTI